MRREHTLKAGILKFVTSVYRTNTYLIYTDHVGIVIDVGDYIEEVIKTVHELDIRLEAIVITHGHADHFSGIPRFKQEFPDAVIYMNFNDIDVAEYTMYQLYPDLYEYLYNMFRVERDLKEGVYAFDIIEIKAIETPGHTPGSMTLYIPTFNALFTGDTLFAGTIGRTDLVGGSEEDIAKSICKIYTSVPIKTTVYPGHGSETSLEIERSKNIYVKSFLKECKLSN